MKPILSTLFLSFAAAAASAQDEDIPAVFDVADGLEVSLWAESPHFFNPTNIDVDARGRLWVCEGVNYRNKHKKDGYLKHPEGDRIVILEDTNGDGTCDSSKVFVQDKDLIVPLGIAVLGNKVVVSCSPNVIVYTDEDGDDKPDKKEVFLKGFGGRDHDHGVHAFVGGPDGRWYFNHGNDGGKGTIVDASGRKHTANKPGGLDGRLYLQGCIMRIEPDGTKMAVLAHNFRNNYEMTIDSFGGLWQNDNDDDGNQGCRTTWVMEGGNYGYRSADGKRSWRVDMRPGQQKPEAHTRYDDPGVVPSSDLYGNGAPTGIVRNEGEGLGRAYKGDVFSCESRLGVVFGYDVTAKGAGYVMERYDFLKAKPGAPNQKMFRPADVAVGTDGTVYVADWWDPGVGGHNMRDDKGYGRILRITPKGAKPKAPKVDLSTVEGQAEALTSPAINVRYQAHVALHAGGEKALGAVAEMFGAEDPYLRARALWILARWGSGPALHHAANDADPGIRAASFRAMRLTGHDVLGHAAQFAKDKSAGVRREVAVSLLGAPMEAAKPLILELVAHFDGKDRYMLEAIGIACEGKEEALYGELAETFGDEDPLKWSDRFAALMWRLHPPSAVPGLKARAQAAGLSKEARAQAVVALAFTIHESAAKAMKELAANGPADVKTAAAYWVKHRSRFEWKPFGGGK